MSKEKKHHPVSKILTTIDTLKYRMMFYSMVIGLLSGLVIVAYRIIGEFFLERLQHLYPKIKERPLFIIIFFLFLIMVSLFVSFCVKKEPHISGSGIPQVEGIATRQLHVNWKQILFYKFFGGIATLACGLSIGREGPSIQMGAAIGQGVGETVQRMDHEEKYLLTSGASAGLAAAFHAPLAGVMFALEEVHKNFSPIVLTSAMISALTADIVAKSLLGLAPALHFSRLPIMPIQHYWALVLLGIVAGISSWFFNHGLLAAKHLYKKSALKLEWKIMIPFLLSGVLGLSFPLLIGGGHSIIINIGYMKLSILMILALFVAKYLFTFASFGSGVPGGIFFPLLALGAILGNLAGVLCIQYLGVHPKFLITFIILAMAGHFAAIVKAPITSIILIYEMTGSFDQLLPLSIVVFCALITSDLLHVEPVYDLLLEDLIRHKNSRSYQGKENQKTLLELSVSLGSPVEGKQLSELDFPKDSLVVAIYRGKQEMIPRGSTRILSGDLLLIMVNQKDSPNMLQALSHMTGSLPTSTS